MSERETRIKQLRYRAWRRGFREHDFLMGTFADTQLEGLGDADVAVFEALLNEADWDVYYWIVGQNPTPERYQGAVMDALQQMRFTVATIGNAL
jgi:antitoxin CptB